jgi:hypothetical protein
MRLTQEVMMFVVRLKRPNEEFDFKMFASGDAALARFRTAQQMMIDGEVEECALFEARAADAASAMAMINDGSAALIEANLGSVAEPKASVPKA